MDRAKALAGKVWRWYKGLRIGWQIVIGLVVVSVIVGPFLPSEKDGDSKAEAATTTSAPSTTTTEPATTLAATTTAATTTTTTTQPPPTTTTTTAAPATTTTVATTTTTTTTLPATTTTVVEADRVRDVLSDEMSGGFISVEMPDALISPDRVTVTVGASESFTEGLTKDSARLRVFEALRGLVKASLDPSVTRFRVIVTYDLVNQYGEVTNSPVVDVVYDRPIAERIQFDNVVFTDILRLPTVNLFVHPAFAKDDGS